MKTFPSSKSVSNTFLLLPLLLVSHISQVVGYVTSQCPSGATVQTIAGTSSNPLILDSITVNGGCTILRNASLSGSITVLGGGKLISTLSTISGSILVEEALSCAFLGSGILVQGSVEVKNAGGVTINGANVVGGLKYVESGSFESSVGGVDIRGASTFLGEVSIEKSIGLIRIADLQSSTDLKIVEHEGNTSLTNCRLSDVFISLLTGNFVGSGIVTDSDIGFSEISGSVSLQSSTIVGDTMLEEVTGSITLNGNNFSSEAVKITKPLSTVTISNNYDISISVEESAASVSFSGNTFEYASFSKNTGGLSIINNSGFSISCTDNDPLQTGSNNVVELDECENV